MVWILVKKIMGSRGYKPCYANQIDLVNDFGIGPISLAELAKAPHMSQSLVQSSTRDLPEPSKLHRPIYNASRSKIRIR